VALFLRGREEEGEGWEGSGRREFILCPRKKKREVGEYVCIADIVSKRRVIVVLFSSQMTSCSSRCQ